MPSLFLFLLFMTTLTPTKPIEATLDNYTWTSCEYGQYRIEATRFGMYRSIDKEDKPLVIGATEDAVHTMTPIHMFAHTPEYDGRYDTVVKARTHFVEL